MTGAIGKIYQDVLHPRRPTLNYVSPAICEASFSGTSFATLILSALSGLGRIQGFRLIFNPNTGRFRLYWDTFGNAICYNVYLADTPGDPNTTYTLFLECSSDNFFDPPPDFPDCCGCIIVTAITPDGETPFSLPTCSNPPIPPDAAFFSVEYTAVCPFGFAGTPVTIPAATFGSVVSQADADAQAAQAGQAALVCTAGCSQIPWVDTVWTNVNFFGSASSGTVALDTITFNSTGIPSTETDGLEAVGNLVYSGPMTVGKIIVSGGPFDGNFNINIDHSVAGNLLIVNTGDVTTSPQEFQFLVPASVGDTLTITGAGGSSLIVYTQSHMEGSIQFSSECPIPLIYSNAEYTAVCPDGTTGDPVTIPANTYFSIIGQADADAKATAAGDGALVCNSGLQPAVWWPLEEDAMDNRVDAISGVVLTANGDVSRAAGRVDNGARFVSVAANGFLNTGLADAALENTGAGFTFTGWVKFASATSVLPGGSQVRLVWYDSDVTFRVLYPIGSTIYSEILDNSGLGEDFSISADSGIAPTVGTWCFFRAWYDISIGKVGIQINNGAKIESAGTHTWGSSPSNGLNFGVFPSGACNIDYVQDEFNFFPFVISDTTATALYNGGAGVTWPVYLPA